MGNLIKAEFRKILTTKVWWGLMIPAVLLAFFWALGAGAVVTQIGDFGSNSSFQELDISFSHLPLGVIALARSINISSVLAGAFGVLAFATEIQRKTITTTFLTAPNRILVLSAKTITYVAWGAIYGVVITGFAALGTLAGASHYYPSIGDTLLIMLAGIVSSVLMTMLGVGLGALLGSAVGAMLSMVLYFVVVGPLSDIILANHVAGALPNGAQDGLTSSTAADALISSSQELAHTPLIQALGTEAYDAVVLLLRAASGGLGSFSWWASGLIFLAWSLVFLGGGLAMNKQRDIT